MKRMKFTVNPRIFVDFDNPRIAITSVKGANNLANITVIKQELKALEAKLEKEYGQQMISQLPKIAAWREAYRLFGVKAKDYPSSVEALYKRVSKGGSVAGINPIVDIYNYISLKYIVPAGGEDTDKMTGDLELTYATADERPVTVLGKAEAQAPVEGEVIYKDDEGTICRRWNWREVERTILTGNTKNCILVLEGLNPLTDAELQDAQQELGELVVQYCGGTVEHFVLDKGKPEASF